MFRSRSKRSQKPPIGALLNITLNLSEMNFKTEVFGPPKRGGRNILWSDVDSPTINVRAALLRSMDGGFILAVNNQNYMLDQYPICLCAADESGIDLAITIETDSHALVCNNRKIAHISLKH